MDVDQEFANFNVIRLLQNADKLMNKRSGRYSGLLESSTGNTPERSSKKRRFGELQDDNDERLFMNIVIEVEDFVVDMLFKTASANFKQHLANNMGHPLVSDVMRYYIEFKSIIHQAENYYQRSNFSLMYSLFVNDFNKLAINYYQTLLIYNSQTVA